MRKLFSVLIAAVVMSSVPVAIASDYDKVDCCLKACS